VAIGTDIEPVPVTGLAANFSPIPRIAPPPFGRFMEGGLIWPSEDPGSFVPFVSSPLFKMNPFLVSG
jgi:hypothetical protein